LAAICSSLPDPVVILQLGAADMSRPSLASRPRRRAYIDKAEGFVGRRRMKDRSRREVENMHALAKFGLATVLVTLAVLSNVLVTLSALSGANAQIQGPQPEALDWQTFLVPEFGTTVEYPAGIFAVPDGKAETGIGQRFNSADGRSLLTIYSRENEAGDTPASYLKNNLRVGPSALDYERVTRSFFTISSTRQGLIFYSRCNFSTDAGGAIHCLDLVYPQAEKRAWDSVVTRISRSLRPLEG
jgi:hypothetical protein